MRAGLSCLVAFLALSLVLPSPAHADPSDLSGGVFIAHAPSSLEYSSGYDWCQKYDELFAISSCEEQNPRIDLDGNLGERSVWYVIAAWGEEKEWCGTEFGFGSYDPAIYSFLDWGACLPNELEISTTNWPGPNEGTAVVATDTQWEGNFQTVYYFSGYAYTQDLIPLADDPAQAFGGFGNCHVPADLWEAEYGAMGLFQEGVSVCPGETPTAGLETLFDEYSAVCCLGHRCLVLPEDECQTLGGEYHADRVFCGPLACKEGTIEPYGGGALRMTVTGGFRFQPGGSQYSTTHVDSLRQYYHQRPWRPPTSCVVQRSHKRIPTVQLIDDYGQWTAQLSTISSDHDMGYPRFMRIPCNSAFLLFHDDGSRHYKAIVDSSGHLMAAIEDGCIVGAGGLAVDDSGEYLLCLERYRQAAIALQRGANSKSHITSLEDLGNHQRLPMFGGVAAPGDGGFWLLSHREQDIAHAGPLGVCRTYLSHVARDGRRLQGILVSESARPVDIVRGPGAVYALYWEAQGEARHPRLSSAPLTSLYSSYPQGRHLHALAFDGTIVNDKSLNDLGRFEEAQLIKAEDGSVVILADQTIIPLSGIEIRTDKSWKITDLLPTDVAFPARQCADDQEWTCRLLNSEEGWLAIAELRGERAPDTGLVNLIVDVWRIGTTQACRANVVGDKLETKTRGQFYPLVTIDGATDEILLMSIADLGTLMLGVAH